MATTIRTGAALKLPVPLPYAVQWKGASRTGNAPRVEVGTSVANAPAFDWGCERLETMCSLDRLETRGTIRLALKQAGLEARSVTSEQMIVMLDKVLPAELSTRGIERQNEICGHLRSGLERAQLAERDGEAPDEVFLRLGGS